MKKILSIALIATLSFTLVACDSSSGDDSKTTASSTPAETTASVEPTIASTNEPVETADSDSDDLSSLKGITNGNVYENKSFGLGFKLDSSWKLASEDELLSLAGIIVSSQADEDLKKALQNANMIYDFYAENADTNSSISIAIEKASSLSLAIVSDEEFLESTLEQTKKALEANGATNLNASLSKQKIDSKDFNTLIYSYECNGISIYTTQFIIKNSINYFSLTFTSIDKSVVDKLISSVYLVD